MTLKIEEGKFYRTRDGQKVGPMTKAGGNFCWRATLSSVGMTDWTENGLWRYDGTSDYDLVNEWADEPETPKLWRDMTPEEKGALLLARHEGKRIEQYSPPSAGLPVGWFYRKLPYFMENCAYRVRPEPKRETVTLWVHYNGKDVPVGKVDLLDGKPDLDSLVM